MVLQPSGPRICGSGSRSTHPEPQRPDAVRIVGLSGTLALNAMLLLVLLVPASRDALDLALPERTQEFTWITAHPVQPPRPPEPAEVVQPRSVPAPMAQQRAPQQVAPAEAPVLVEAGIPYEATAADAPAVVDAAPAIDTALPAGLALQYAHAPAPEYPRAALLAGAEGVVVLEVHVGRDGRPVDVRVHRSSGNRELDRAALRQIQRRWTFLPAMRDGVAVEATGLVPVAFNLARG